MCGNVVITACRDDLPVNTGQWCANVAERRHKAFSTGHFGCKTITVIYTTHTCAVDKKSAVPPEYDLIKVECGMRQPITSLDYS